MVEYCTLLDRNSGNQRSGSCSAILSSNVVVKWYTSMGLILSFWGFIIDFIMGTLLIVAIYRVRSIRKALGGVSEKYRRKAHTAFEVWAYLLLLVIALAFVHTFHPGVYNTIHINNIVTLAIEILNTLQVFSSTSND
jgi:hypothetical protein